MDEVCTKHDQNATKKSHYDRLTIATKVMEFEHMTSTAYSERAAANEMGIPRTTLRHWGSRLGTSGLPQATEAFLESPEGHAFLHRLMVAAKLVIVEAGGCGIRALEKFLQLTQLDYFVASSVGALQKQMVDMEEAIFAYEQEE
jgi:hypothetical protein